MSAQNETAPTTLIKVTLEDKTRDIVLPLDPTPTWSSFVATIVNEFSLDHSDLVLQYQDFEQDTLTLSTDSELSELWQTTFATSRNHEGSTPIAASFAFKVVLREPSITPTVDANTEESPAITESLVTQQQLLDQLKSAIKDDPSLARKVHHVLHEARFESFRGMRFDPLAQHHHGFEGRHRGGFGCRGGRGGFGRGHHGRGGRGFSSESEDTSGDEKNPDKSHCKRGGGKEHRHRHGKHHHHCDKSGDEKTGERSEGHEHRRNGKHHGHRHHHDHSHKEGPQAHFHGGHHSRGEFPQGFSGFGSFGRESFHPHRHGHSHSHGHTHPFFNPFETLFDGEVPPPFLFEDHVPPPPPFMFGFGGHGRRGGRH